MFANRDPGIWFVMASGLALMAAVDLAVGLWKPRYFGGTIRMSFHLVFSALCLCRGLYLRSRRGRGGR